VQPGDIIIDGGNSHFTDTCAGLLIYRAKTCILPAWAFWREEGAAKGPAFMPAVIAEAYPAY